MDDTTVETQLGDDSGNLYKPEGDSATFAAGTFNEEEMYKKSNKKAADYSDVESLYEVINSSLRESDTEKWKAELEAIFNVDGFTKWLAVNSVIQNWDTYGAMSHNYYLYNDAETGLLNWIPWDNNESLQQGKRGSSTLSLEEVGEEWPLIRYILDDSEYESIYSSYIEEFTTTIFTTENMTEIYSSHYELLQDYITKDSVDSLINHTASRSRAVADYLDK